MPRGDKLDQRAAVPGPGVEPPQDSLAGASAANVKYSTSAGFVARLSLALEPRFMYDAAGAATAATLADTADAANRGGHDAAAEQDANTASADDAGDAHAAGDSVLPDADDGGTVASAEVTEIVFVDARLPDLDQLSARAGLEVVVLDPAKNGIAQVSEALAGRQGLTAIHFVGHGDSGTFSLGDTQVDAATLAREAGAITGWSSALTEGADIMIWGCDVASMPAGEALIESLSRLTGADVAASIDATGFSGAGGDWMLERATGTIETAIPFEAASLAGWEHLLDPPTISGATKLTVAEPSSLNAAGADRASLAGWQLTSTASGNVTVTATVGDTSIGTLENGSGLGTEIAGGWSFTGTLAEANAWLDSLAFVATDVERGNGAAATAISLTIADADGGSANRSIAVEVTPSNDPAILDDPQTAVVEGGSVTLDATVLAPSDPEVTVGTQVPSQIVYRLTGAPQYGYLTLNGQRIGTGSIFTQQDVIDGELVYVHTGTGGAQNSSDSFTVSVNDGATPQANSDIAIVTLNVIPVNQAPTVSGSGAVYEGQPANAVNGSGMPQSVVGSFIEATGGGDPGDGVLIVAVTDLPDHGKLYFTGTATIGGVVQTLTNHEITAANLAAGFSFAYADRAGLTYANDGIDGVNGRPPNDSFGVRITDGGGGTGTPASTTATIDLTIRPVNDDPTWVSGSTQEATVSEPTGNKATDYKVTLTTAMLNVTDVDSAPENITFVVTSQTGLDQGRLIYDDGSGPALLPEGGTFTLADVIAGRVQYWQMAGAVEGVTDTFNFQVVDNAVGPRWNTDGTSFQRLGGIYTGPTGSDVLQTFAFTINLVATPTGADGSGLPTRNTATSSNSSNHAGTSPTGGVTYGSLSEGGTVVLTNGSSGQPGLSYTANGVDPSQVVYTILGFNGVADGWNGELQKLVGGQWTTLSVYDTFTQADLDSGAVRFQHDGGEDFESSVLLQATAGVLVSDGNGGLTTDQWSTEFFFYVRPVNDAPEARGSSDNVIQEGDTVPITSGMLNFGDADDADSESYLEGTLTLADGSTNYAVNHDASEPLTFIITDAPDHGKLQYRDGSGNWLDVTAGMEIDASWITNDPATTRLRYLHDGFEARADAFSVQATDRWGATSDLASVGFVITNLNDAPQIAENPAAPDPTGNLPGTSTPGTGTNQPLEIIYEGSFSQITPAMLQAIDPDSSAEQVQYRVTTAPAHGRIAYSTDGVNFLTIGVGSSFSQADVAAGRIYYLSDGTDPVSTGYPGTSDDKFVFTLADGGAEQTGREFWIYLEPTNDAPVVTAPTGPIPVTDNLTSIPGFSVSDPDLVDYNSGQEVDFIEVVVRLLDENGQPFDAASYVDVDISVAGTATIDSVHDGNGDFLVLRGTRAQINDALDSLRISFGDDHDQKYQVQVIVDDRVRDADGNLVDRDPDAAGTQPGGNGGGTLNQPETTYTGTAETVPATEYNWYTDDVPTTGAIAGNIAAARVTIWASSENDPATLGSTNSAANVYEDQATPIGGTIDFHISDNESTAFDTPVTVRLTVASGTLDIGTDPAVTVSGQDSGTLVLTGTAEKIEALLNSSLTYTSAANVNHDTNGAADGDVTLTVSFDDTGSNYGSEQVAANPADLAIALTIIPVNDAPTVSAGTGTIVLTGQTPIPGFSVGDVDIGDASDLADGEADFVEVTVRITSDAGVPLSGAQHSEVVISSFSVPAEGTNFEIDDTYDGSGSALVIRGTRAEVNAYLEGLRVEFTGDLANTDNYYKIEVVVDDRMRDMDGGLTSGANGGLNDNGGNGTAAVPTNAIDPYAAIPNGLSANVSSASRDLFPSTTNNPAEINLDADPVRNEDSGTVQLSGITISDSDALDDDLTATVTLPSGFTIASVNGSTIYPGVGTGSVTIVGTVAEINATLNSIHIQLPDVAGSPASSDWNGHFDVTIEVNDGGNNGGRPGSLTGDTNDPTANPGDFAYADGTSAELVTTRTFTVTVSPVNDAPQVVGGPTETLPSVAEDSTPSGKTVSDLFEGHFSDPLDIIPDGSTSNNLAGVAIVGLDVDPAQGRWQYFDGADWVDVGARSAANALILAADTPVRFLPNADFHGTPNSMTVRLVETGDGGNGSAAPGTGTTVDLSSSGATGGTTRYSADTITVSTTVTNVNDRPTLDGGILPPVAEDTAQPPGSTVGALFGVGFGDGTDNQTAVSGGGDAATELGGIAIVGNGATAAEGTWQYSIDGGSTWSDVPTSVSDAAAVLLPTDAVLRFVPAANFNGEPGGLTVRGSDSPVTFTSSADISSTVSNQASTWSMAQALTTQVTPQNDAPVLAGTPSNPIVIENGDTGSGDSVPPTRLVTAGSVDLSDLDLTTTGGLSSGVFGTGTITVSLGTSYRAGDILFFDGTLPAGVTLSGGTDGTLTITLAEGTTVAEAEALIEQIAYRNSSDNPTNFGADTTRSYTITIVDGNNAQAGGNAGGPTSLGATPINGTITITATNDPPTAVDDLNSIDEDTPSVGGNVIAGAADGAGQDSDSDSQTLTVVDVVFAGETKTVGTSFAANYGTLTLHADGTYTYDLDNTNPAVNALKDGDPPLTETFTYTISDGSGGTDTATLTITINGRTDGVPGIVPVDGNGGAAGQAEVSERGLGDPSNAETTTGSIAVTAPDGLASVTVGGRTVTLAELGNLGNVPVVIDTGEGTLTLTGFTPNTGGVPTSGTVTYSYTLKAAQPHPGTGESFDTISVTVTDVGGDTTSGSLVVRIIDDVPVANADNVGIGEDAANNTVTGNVVAGTGGPGNVADDVGADGPSASGTVTGVSFGASTGSVGAPLAGAYGSLTLNSDGSYSYVLDNSHPAVNALPAGQTLAETFSYTITDADGDTATTTLTITITGANDAPVIAVGDHRVSGREDGAVVFTPGDFAFTDVDTGNALQAVRIVDVPTAGALYLDGVPVGAGSTISVADIAAGKLTFRPAADGNGASYASFTYQVGDGAAFSAPGTMNIDIAPRNDTPTIGGPTSATATEEVPLAFDGAGGDNHAPVIRIDDLVDLSGSGATDFFTVTLSVSHGTLTISDPGGDITGEGGGDTLTLTGTRDALNAALQTLTYVSDPDFSGQDRLVINVDDHVNAGTGDGAEPGTASHVVQIDVTGDADPPVLTFDPAHGMEDTWLPLDIGVAPADISDSETISLDLSGMPAGWEIRVGGGRAMTSTGPGQVFSFTANDLAAGLSIRAAADANTAPGRDVHLNLMAKSTDGGSVAITTGQLNVAIDPINDRPVASGAVMLPTINGIGTAGGTVSELFGNHYSDMTDDRSVSHGADRDTPLAGIAITGNSAKAAEGVWQYDLGDGAGWRDIPTKGLGDSSALILPSNAQLRFVPADGFSGTPGGLVVRLSDGTGFPPVSAGPGERVDLTSPAAGALGNPTGGWSAAAVPVAVTVNAIPGNLPDDADPFEDHSWGVISSGHRYDDQEREGILAYLEGRPVDRYTVTWQPISQQMYFRQSGLFEEGGTLFYEAGLGRNQPLPYWITFNASTQTVTAIPGDDVEPGIYVVRVVARDAAGHEAESALTIHVLRDNAKSLEEIRYRAAGKITHSDPAASDAETVPDREAGEEKGGAETIESDKNRQTDLNDRRVEAVRGASLTSALIAHSATGQMIEATRFLEALAADARVIR